MAGATTEIIAEGQGGQGCKPSRASAGDHAARSVDPPYIGQVPRAVHAVIHIHDSPIAVQAQAVLPAETRAAAIIHVQNGNAPAGPVLGTQVQDAGGSRCRAAMALHYQRGPVSLWRLVVRIEGRVEQTKSRPVSFRWKLNRFYTREVAREVRIVGQSGSFLQDLGSAGCKAQLNEARRDGWRPGAKDHQIPSGANGRKLGIRQIDRIQLARLQIDHTHSAEPLRGIRADQPSGAREGVSGHAEEPLRLAELGLHW